MIKCILCGREFKVITPKHLKSVHGITMSQYRERFPDAPIYDRERYSFIRDVGVFERGKTPEALGLMCLRRYSDPEDVHIIERLSSREARLTIDMQAWSKTSRLRIERLFN